MKDESNDLSAILTQVLEEMRSECGDSFDLHKVNLAELGRRTHISRSKLRRLKKNNFEITPNKNKGKKAAISVLTGFTGILDNLLKDGVYNSEVSYKKLCENGYTGGKTAIKTYLYNHKYLLPAKREVVSPQGNRGRRYTSNPGECYQMDWGFVHVQLENGKEYQAACFAMICHHCGMRFTEFFPNAKQENLFIGMIHAFQYMGIPETILTDNMKSVTTGRDCEGHPIWQKDYEQFMNTIGFKTKLCKPRHPFTKGAVERLVRFIKENFMVGRTFGNITDLNIEAMKWCVEQNGIYHKAVDCIPAEEHARRCAIVYKRFQLTPEIERYLAPSRRISFDGFINYEGRRFGVPYSYKKRLCRVCRKQFELYIFDDDMTTVLCKHNVTWGRKDSYCADQFVDKQPEEFPTQQVTTSMKQVPTIAAKGFEKFDFMHRGIEHE